MTRIITCCLLCLVSLIVQAQPRFVSSGKIIFERKIDVTRELENRPWIFLGNDKAQIPRYNTTLHNLYFTKDKTLFEQEGKEGMKHPYYAEDRGADDVIYTDLKKGTFVKKKGFFEENIWIADSLRHVKWEMTNEVRNIAGFDCHKATTIILDSVYVIAFYCDEIISNGGPMSYGNLPGMILGLVIPRMNLTLFATSINITEPNLQQLNPPSVSPVFNYQRFTEYIKKSTQNLAGDQRDRIVLRALL